TISSQAAFGFLNGFDGNFWGPVKGFFAPSIAVGVGRAYTFDWQRIQTADEFHAVVLGTSQHVEACASMVCASASGNPSGTMVDISLSTPGYGIGGGGSITVQIGDSRGREGLILDSLMQVTAGGLAGSY